MKLYQIPSVFLRELVERDRGFIMILMLQRCPFSASSLSLLLSLDFLKVRPAP